VRWPFGRRSRPPDEAATRASGARVAPAFARPHDAWRSLPPVQRTVGEPPVVAPVGPFADSLATRRPPELALEVLGHEVSPLASPGLVVGVARPVGAALTGRVDLPLQRAAIDPESAPAESAGWSPFDEPAQSRLEATGAGAPAGAGTSADPSRAGSAATSTTGGESDVHPVMIQRLALGGPILTTSAGTPVPGSPAGTLDLRPAVARVAAGPSLGAPTPIRPTEPGPALPVPAAPPTEPPARRPTLGQARRLGLGAPLRNVHERAVQRRAEPAAVLPSGVGLPVVPISQPIGPAGPGPDPTAIPSAPDSSASEARSRRLAAVEADAGLEAGAPGELPVVRPNSIQRVVVSEPIASVGAVRPVTPTASDLPLVSGRAGQTISAVSEDAEVNDPGSGRARTGFDEVDEPGAAISPLGGSAIRVSSASSLLAPAGQTEAGQQRRVATTGRASLDGPVVARSVVESSRAPAGPGRPPSLIETGFGAGPRHPQVGPLVQLSHVQARSPMADTAAQLAPPLVGAPIPVQRAVVIPEIEVRPAPTEPAPGASSSPGASPGSPAAPAAAASPAERDRELDELARRLYGRIRTRLSAELLADRERAGLITDLR
jgi:hypothetical protein